MPAGRWVLVYEHMFVPETCSGSVAEAVRAASSLDRAGWSTATSSAELVGLLVAQERLNALVVAVAAEWDRARAWAVDGALSPVAWLAQRAPLTRQAAATLVRTARHVAAHPATAKALDAGDVTAAHVELTARAARDHDTAYAVHEQILLDTARTTSPAEFHSVARHWRSCAHSVADHAEAVAQVEGNYLRITPTFDGVGHLEGCLDPVSTATLVQALDALAPIGSVPKGSLAQRRAAALLRLAHGDRPPRTEIDVTIDLDTLAGRTPTDLRAAVCEIKGHGSIDHVLAQVLACDAAIGRVVTRGRSEVLDVGRRTRLVTTAQRRALHIRDRTCTEPGCDVPATWCDAHHLIPWTEGGPTDLDHLTLKCRRHHLEEHRRTAQRHDE